MEARLIKEYLEKCRDVWQLADRTVQARGETFDLYFNKYQGELTLDSFEGFLSWLKKRKNTAQTIVARGGVVRLFIKYCVKKGVCQDFVDDIKLPKIYSESPIVVDVKDAEKAIFLGTEIKGSENKKIQRNKIEARAALRFDLRTGLRKEELLNLKPKHIRLEEKIFFVETTKSHKTVPMPLPFDMLDEIKERMNRQFIFEPSSSNALNNYLHIGSKKANLSVRLHIHMLRASFCSDLLKRSIPPQTVKDLMRHADFSSLTRYSAAQMQDKILALNSSPLITKALGPEQIIKILEESIDKSGIKNNRSVRVSVIKERNRFLFEARW